MNEAPALVYKAITPEPLQAEALARQTEVDRFDAEVATLSAELGGRELTGFRFFAGGFSVTSYRMNDVNDLLPGWRRDGSSMRAVPAKRTPEGKEWAKRLGTVRQADGEPVGYPARMRCDGFSLYPQVRQVGSEFFLLISMKPYEQYLEQVDPTVRAPAKLSDYFLALEAAEEA
jgi:hypothetical protein